MLKKSTLIRSLILALTFSCAQSHALDPYWGKWLSGIIGTVGLITTFNKPIFNTFFGFKSKTAYQIYWGIKLTTDSKIRQSVTMTDPKEAIESGKVLMDMLYEAEVEDPVKTLHWAIDTQPKVSKYFNGVCSDIKDFTQNAGLAAKQVFSLLWKKHGNTIPTPQQSPLIHRIPSQVESKAQNLSLKQRQQLGILYLTHQPPKVIIKVDQAHEPQFAYAKNRAHYTLRKRECDYGFEKNAFKTRT